MRALFAAAMLSVICATAFAKPTPVEQQAVATAPDDLTIATGPVGAMLEQDYFSAPKWPRSAGHEFRCRLHTLMFDTTRLAQACD